MTSGNLVQDEQEDVAIPVRDVLKEYLEQLPLAIDEFKSLQDDIEQRFRADDLHAFRENLAETQLGP